MVMEEPPSPQCVGREFVRQYYTLLNKAPVHLHRFYNNASSFVHGGMDAPDRETAPVIGQKEIHNRIQQLNFRDCHAKISQVDSQATLGNGVVVQVTGELSNGGQPMRRFTQTFVLAAQSPKQYYVHNDIFRYQDLGFPDDDAEWEYSRPEAEQPQQAPQQPPPAALPAPYFPPAAPSAVQSPPQPAQLAPPISPPMPAQQLQEHAGHNGHQTDDGQGNTSMPVSDSSCNDVDVGSVEMEPEEEMPIQQQSSPVQVAPIPHEPAPVISSEPKTYANLLKSGPISSFAQSLQQHHVNTQPPPGMSGRVGMQRQEPPAPAPHQHHQQQQQQAPPSQQPQRQPRPQRTQRNDSTSDSGGQGSGNTPPGSGSSGLSRKYSDSQQLFLGNLPHQATKEELRTLFEKFGPIVDLRVYSKQVGGAGAAGPPGPGGNRVLPNYAFLIYEDSQSAHNCLNHGALYYPSEDSPDAQLLNVQEKKSRMGGGGGGGPPGGGGGRGSSGGGRSGPRPPRPSFNRGPYQPQQQNNPPRR